MLQEAYKAVLAVCDALVPGNGLELMDALMETTAVYRKRYGYKKNLFDLDSKQQQQQQQQQQQPQPQQRQEEEDAAKRQEKVSAGARAANEKLVRLTPCFRSLGGSFWLGKDKNFRRPRSSFPLLARSQRARMIKATYELIQAVGEEFSPGTRLELLDRVFKHHTTLR
jgi:hypothetical protein